jgi:coproporphyrinogen III oxidase
MTQHAERPLRERAAALFRETQDRITSALEGLDGGGRFREDGWERPGGGGGRTRVLEDGGIFERAGVNFSEVHGDVPAALDPELRGEGPVFFASGVSLVLHPKSPHIPTVHANFRYLERGGKAWFGGGLDLTPAYARREDVVHFHRTLREACDRHDPAFYPRFKKWCDEYFYIPHRREMRGVGGIFFDDLPPTDGTLAFVADAAGAFLPAYVPIVERRKDVPWNEREREFQLLRRGRYAEFNLVYDRGTVFGLRSFGRVESILMSLPPQARWAYDWKPLPDSQEELAMTYFQPRDWLGEG